MSEVAAPAKPSAWSRIDPAVATAFACIVALLFVGSLYSRNFLSPEYLLQQFKVASFLGVIASGMMLAILIGQIDLSLPWVVTVGAMMSCAMGHGPWGSVAAVPVGILCGVAIGCVNGFGVAYLRIPSMIITLATNAVAQGLMVVYTGGFSPRDSASPVMRYLATGFTISGLPNAVLCWAAVAWRRSSCSSVQFWGALSMASAIANARSISRASTRAVSFCWFSPSRAEPRLSAAFSSPATRPRRRNPWATRICCRRSPPSCWAEHRSWAAAAPILAPWQACC